MAMAPGSIVKDFDVIEDICPGQIAGFVDAFADTFLFQTAKERFGDCVIPTISAPAHALFEIVRLQEIAPVVTAELAALIRVDHEGLLRLASPDSHQQSVQGQLAIRPRSYRLPDDLA